MVVNLPPAYPPAGMGSKGPTAFETFLKQRQDGGASAPFSNKQAQSNTDKPPAVPALRPPSQQRLRTSPGQLPPPSNNALVPSPVGKLQQQAGSLLQALNVAPATPGPAAPRTPQYTVLAEAASTLATAAKSLAAAPKADPSVTQSYQVLARAAEDLASNFVHQPQRPEQRSSFLPFAGQDAAAAGGSRPMTSASSTVSGRGRVTTPKFPAYNPLIHVRTSELPPPGTPQHLERLASRGGSRPTTANPITHELDPLGAAAAASYGASRGASRSGTAMAVARGPPGSALPSARGAAGPGDSGSDVAQVLYVSTAGDTVGTVGGSGGAGAGQQQQQQAAGSAAAAAADDSAPVDAVTFVLEHPDRVRLVTWPPPGAFTRGQITQDDLALKYNRAIAAIRDKIYVKGSKAMANTFKTADADGSGYVDPREFKNTILAMDLGTELMDDQVIDLVTHAIDKDDDGRINYAEFIGALRFNKVPYMRYDPRFKHRSTGNPDAPFGPAAVSFPYGTMVDAAANEAAVRTSMDNTWRDVHEAFAGMDKNGDGVVNLEEFKTALKKLDERHNLKLTEYYIKHLFREADVDYSQGIDWQEFLAAFAGNVSQRFMPEFLKPKSLRCSIMGPPWEWRGGSKVPEAHQALLEKRKQQSFKASSRALNPEAAAAAAADEAATEEAVATGRRPLTAVEKRLETLEKERRRLEALLAPVHPAQIAATAGRTSVVLPLAANGPNQLQQLQPQQQVGPGSGLQLLPPPTPSGRLTAAASKMLRSLN